MSLRSLGRFRLSTRAYWQSLGYARRYPYPLIWDAWTRVELSTKQFAVLWWNAPLFLSDHQAENTSNWSFKIERSTTTILYDYYTNLSRTGEKNTFDDLRRTHAIIFLSPTVHLYYLLRNPSFEPIQWFQCLIELSIHTYVRSWLGWYSVF